MDGDFDPKTGEIVPADPKLRHWDELCRTDPKHTKPFTRAGGFKGTAIRPIWNQYRLTEHFGPAGIGWGFEKPEYEVVKADDELMVFCTVKCWYMDDNGERADIYGVGGDKVLAKQQRGLVSDDEAFKKALTDAIGNAFVRVGLSADVHMGLFEDSKYVQDTRQHFAQAEDTPESLTEARGAQETGRYFLPAARSHPKRPEAAPAPSDDKAKAVELYKAMQWRIDEAATVKGLETVVPSLEWKALDDLLHKIMPADRANTAMSLLRDRIEARKQDLLGGTG